MPGRDDGTSPAQAFIHIPNAGRRIHSAPVFRGTVKSPPDPSRPPTGTVEARWKELKRSGYGIADGTVSVGGQWEFNVGGEFLVELERINPREPFDAPIYLTASYENRRPITVEWHDAVTGRDVKTSLAPRKGVELVPTRQRFWIVSGRAW